MVVGIIFIIIAATLIGIHYFVRHMDSRPVELYQGSGTIDRMTHTDSGNVNYYVKFLHEGKEIRGKTETYPSSARPKENGEYVEFDYTLLRDNRAYIVIHDERYVSPAEKKTPSNGLLKVALGILAAGIIIIVICCFI